MYLARILENSIQQYLQAFPALGLIGPRQAGKSTLLQQQLSAHYHYVSFDEEDVVHDFYQDPRAFMQQYNHHVIFDEVQRVPELFGYVKRAIDKDRQQYGKFILTGSCQLTLVEHISESLAGRIGYLNLLPLQFSELPIESRKSSVYKGCYPEQVARNYNHNKAWYANYISTYLEKDVRRLCNVGDLRNFRRLLNLLATNTSQVLNMSNYSRALGISVDTIKRWVSILEASFIVFLLRPYHNNFNKRIIKSPKVYFYDTGLVAYLTGIETEEMYSKGPMAGSIFENYVVTEMQKNIYHKQLDDKLYFYRTSNGAEIDVIVENHQQRSWIEIKKSSTFTQKMLSTIKTDVPEGDSSMLIYTVETLPNARNNTQILNYEDYFSD